MVKNLTFFAVAVLLITTNSSATAQVANTEDSIMLAASKCDLTTVKRWLARGASVDSSDEHGNTILSYATESNCVELFEFLIASGANVNAKAKHGGGTPLMTAALFGRVNLAKRLLAAGADVNIRNDAGWTALNVAIKSRHESDELINMLIEAKTDLKAKDEEGNTFLMDAVMMGNISLVKLFIASGVEVNAKNRWGGTALRDAACGSNVEILKILISVGADVNSSDNNKRTPLIWAAICKSVSSIKELLLSNADVNTLDDDGKSALFYAKEDKKTDVYYPDTKEKREEIIRLLKNAGAYNPKSNQ